MTEILQEEKDKMEHKESGNVFRNYFSKNFEDEMIYHMLEEKGINDEILDKKMFMNKFGTNLSEHKEIYQSLGKSEPTFSWIKVQKIDPNVGRNLALFGRSRLK